MAAPSKVTGASAPSTARNVFRVTLSEATTAAPRLEVWDSSSYTSTATVSFTGTTINGNKPLIAAVATTNTAPAASWIPTSAVSGGAVANLMKGSANYVNLHTGAVAAGGHVFFNVAWTIPADIPIAPPLMPGDVEYTLNSLFVVFAFRLDYAGAMPLLTYAFNDFSEGGTEAVPVWTLITPGITGNHILPADAGATPSSVTMHRPQSGVLTIGEVWVV